MNATIKPHLAALALALIFAGNFATHGQEAGTVAAGRRLALEVCARCHVVSADQTRAPVLNPPALGFAEIAARPDVTEETLRKFLSEPHGEARRTSAMPAFLLPAPQVDGVVAYLLSLRPK
jgi:cytochrome c